MKIHLLGSRLVPALALITFAAAVPFARADDYTWAQGSSGDFNTAGWDDNTKGIINSGPPGGGDSAYIPENTVLSCSGGGVDTLVVSILGGGLSLTGGFSVNTLGSITLTGGGNLTANTIGPASAGGTGDTAESINVIGSQLTANNVQNGYLTASAGGSIVIKSSITKATGIAKDPMSVLEVDGSVTNCGINAEGGGSASAQSILLDGTSSGGSQSSADGPGSLLAISSTVELHTQFLSASNGAKITIGGDLDLEGNVLGLQGGAGSAAFDGAGTSVTVAGLVAMVPDNASRAGGMSVSNGAFVHARVFNLDGAAGSGFPASVDMTNGGMLQADLGLTVGNMGPALLSIKAGSGVTLSNGALMPIGFSQGANGSVTVSGPGSFIRGMGTLVAIGKDAGSKGDLEMDTSAAMQLAGAAGATYLHVGDAGAGTMEMTNGATLSLDAQSALEVGSVAGGMGTMSVHSGNACLTLNGPVVVGNAGQGELDLYSSGTTATASGPSFFTGQAATGVGRVTVGGGAQFTLNGGPSMMIGLGNTSGAIGEMEVDGPGSLLNLGGTTIVGVNGAGEIGATGGASAQSTGLEIAATPGSSGNVLVYNSGTIWTETNTLFDGGLPGTPGGHGIIAVNDGGLLRVYRKLYLANAGLVTVTALLTTDSNFPYPAPPMTSTPNGRIFVGTDNFGPDGAIRVGAGGVLSGKGKQTGTSVIHTNVVGKVVVGLGGKFQPGGDPDVFSIQGDCDLSDGGAGGGETDIEVAGAGTAGTDYDELIVTGQVTLGGTLNLVMLNGYTPKVGDTLNIIQAGSITGSFAQVVAPGMTVNPVASSGGLSLMVTSVTATPAPSITSAGSATAYAGQPFSYQITATNAPSGFAATGLPTGLTVDAATGLISGTPTAAGVSAVTLSATNVGGTGSAALSLTVSPALPPGAPTITSATAATGQLSVPFTYQVTASNGPASFGAGGLPAGLSIDTAAGLISGTPAVTGTFAVNLSATNDSGTGTASLTLTINPAPLPVVTAVATVPEVSLSSGLTGEITLTIPSAQANDLEITYTVKGSGAPGVDYVALRGMVKLKAGRTSKVIKITPLGDLGGASKKTVKLILAPGTGYTVGTTAFVKIKIVP